MFVERGEEGEEGTRAGGYVSSLPMNIMTPMSEGAGRGTMSWRLLKLV